MAKDSKAPPKPSKMTAGAGSGIGRLQKMGKSVGKKGQ